MTKDVLRELSRKYCPRFGQLSVEFGFITEAQLVEALGSQVRDELNGKGHRLLGQIFFERDEMSASQIEQVMTEVFRRMRQEEDAQESAAR